MPWMCLERCGFSEEEIKTHLQQIKDHKDVLSGAAFELFNLGPHSQLIVNNFTEVIPFLKALDLETYAMISSFPYPPDFLDWMRQLWKNPQPFFTAAIKQAKHYGFLGYNVDFEPTAKATPQDATDYANFLADFAEVLHKEGLKLTVDIANWNDVWDWKKMNDTTTVDKLMVMSTYVTGWPLWLQFFLKSVDDIELSRLGVGLQCNTKVPLTEMDLKERFAMIKEYGIQEIDIWASPVPDYWWPWIEQFVK